ncbi:hypothetical protein [Maricaulis sp.]|jgi:hypothetical protein|uniref:hypothetical protein n=1 Tax=Maricaulis sp. TaxID=1486257 RepID=UPI002635CF51|nr:hypothetical protein [Maricaulis sp.]MDF1769857.1 hypothetical protein [Maricaulis sp.]
MTVPAIRRGADLPTDTNPLPTLAALPSYALLRMPLGEAIEEAKGNLVQVESMRDQICDLLTPATPDAIIYHLEALTVHHPQRSLDGPAYDIWARDWLEDLREYPPDILQAAFTQWRRNASPWMPKPGQILALAAPILAYRNALKGRCTSIVKALTDERPSAKRSPTDRHEPDQAVKAGLADLAQSLRETKVVKEDAK